MFEAFHESGKLCALKLLDRRGKTAQDVRWLKQEVHMAQKMHHKPIQHPNLLKPLAVFGNNDIRCIVTELAPHGMSFD